MALLEALTVGVGSSIAKSVLRLWLQDHEAARDASLSMVDLLAKAFPQYSERRRASRQFDGLADEVAEKLLPMLEHEYREVVENELLAAIDAVGMSITSAGISVELLVTQDLDPVALERHVRGGSVAVRRGAALSADATEVYDRLLTESCNYTVEIAATLPSLGTAAAVQILRRETEILDLVRTVLERLPEASSREDAASADATFETQYRREAARRLDHLELFGVDATPLSRRYALTVAYITLSSNFVRPKPVPVATPATPATIAPTSGEVAAGEDDDEGPAYLRVNEALASSPRMFVRGQAGSGKTTLLRWLAVRSARQNFVGELGSWNGTVPFVIELRRYVGEDLPSPEMFVRAVAQNVAAEMPSGWVHRILHDGRGLLLVDGVDEIPEEDRTTARDWIASLAETFPATRMVVTSRPAAAGEEWLKVADFEHCDLEPMTPSDIDELIDRWHEAVGSAIEDQDERDELREAAHSLKNRVRDTASLRALATSPLLCAMLCALSRDRKQQIPKDRMELYRIALEMLLERRDVERRIPSDVLGAGDLPDREKRLLLQHFAFWLILNNYSDASRQDAAECFETRIRSMQRVDASGEDVLRHFLERSGLVREAIVGRIDFIHRTFEEYLAAKEAVDHGHIGLLVQNAHLDQWREVVILAAGHSTEASANRLISELVDRGYAEPPQRHKLHLLAVACMGTAVEISDEVSRRLSQCLEELLPPSNMSEAQAVASAGELAVPLLPRFATSRATIAAASVRTLTLIGGDAALQALTHFGRDRRVTVARELIRSWGYFDVEDYAREVLADSVLDFGQVGIVSERQLGALKYLNNLRSFTCRVRGHFETDDFVAVAHKAIRLTLVQSAVTTIDLARCESLEAIRIDNCPDFVDCMGFSGAPALQEVSLSKTAVFDLAPLVNVPQLRTLDVAQTPVRTIAPIFDLEGVQITLDVELRNLHEISPDFLAKNDVRWRVTTRGSVFDSSFGRDFIEVRNDFQFDSDYQIVSQEGIFLGEPPEGTADMSPHIFRPMYRVTTVVPERLIEEYLRSREQGLRTGRS